jgi:hypothetical protein
MRNPGKPSHASTLIAIDCRNRPPPPERLDADERALWDKTVLSRRPQWFVGCEPILEAFVVEAVACRRIEVAMRRLKPGGSKQYATLVQLHHASSRLCASLSVKLRLLPSTVVQRNVSADGDRPLQVNGLGYPQQPDRPDDAFARDVGTGERSFEALRRHVAAQSAARGDANLTEPDSAGVPKAKLFRIPMREPSNERT